MEAYSLAEVPADILAPHAFPFYDVVSALRLAACGRQLRATLPLLVDARIDMRRRQWLLPALQMRTAQSVALCVCSLDGLRSLLVDMSFAACGEAGVQDLARAAGTLPHLCELNLAFQGCGLGSFGVLKLARELAVLQSVTILMLDVSFNNVDDDGLTGLSHMVASLIDLEMLRLAASGACVSDRGVVCLAHALYHLTQLKELSLGLSDNGIGDTGACELAQAVRSLRAPVRMCLGLNRNQMSELGVRNLAFALSGPGLCELKLFFSVGDVSLPGARDIASSVASLQCLGLLALDLNVNQIGATGAKRLAEALLARCLTLVHLKLLLAGNSILEVGLSDLAQALAALSGLGSIELDLSGNGIGDVGVGELASALASLACLSSLSMDLRGNAFGELGVCEFAKAFGSRGQQRQRLKHFELRLSGGSSSRAPGMFGEARIAHLELAHLVQKLQSAGCTCDCSW